MLAAALAFVATRASAQPVATPADWPSYNRTLAGDRYAPQTAVTPATAPRLRVVCTYDFGSRAMTQTGPIVVGNVMYATNAYDLVALDATTCAQKWRTTEAYDPASKLLLINRGAAYAGGRLFRGTQDGRVLAYDAETGERVWAMRIANPAMGETVPAALVVWNGLVFAGNAGGDNKGVKGRMYALDAATGAIRWEQYLVPREANDSARGPAAPAPALPAGSWSSRPGLPIAGGGNWTSYSVDSATGTLYVPVGNPAPDFVPGLRPGPNPYAGSLVALDARTGAVRTAYPLAERDFHDWDVSAAPALITTRAGTRLIAEAFKDGFVYGIDPATGRQRWRVATTTRVNTTTPIGSTPVRFCPGTQGGSEWNGAAFSPATNLVYVGAVDWCTTASIAPATHLRAIAPGKAWFGAAESDDLPGHLDPPGRWAGWLTAVEADGGRVAWKRKLPAPVLGGVTPTAGGVVVVGDIMGHLYVLDARTGATAWTTTLDAGIGGGIVSYADSAGAQRIAVVSGVISGIWPSPKANARITVYGLGPAHP